MILKELTLKSFRCYDTFSLAMHPHLNIIIGNNAQGKTTILEAIHILGLTKSHKTIQDFKLIKKTNEYAKINALFDLNSRKVELSMVLSKNGKKAKYNKIEVSKLSDYIGIINVVMFAPEDLELIKGSPQNRRRFLDIEIGQISKSYVNTLSHYKRLLKERNEVLKSLGQSQKFDERTLEVITEQLIHYAEKIITARQRFIKRISEKIKTILPIITKDDPMFTIQYEPSVNTQLKKAYDQKKAIDLLLKSTQIGPHRDDMQFYFNEEPLKTFASQGQIRSVALALKLAVVEVIYEEKKSYPIVLLDDVFSELDRHRQRRILQYLQDNTQVFITTTQVDHIDFSSIEDYKLITIDAGKIKGDETHGRKTL